MRSQTQLEKKMFPDQCMGTSSSKSFQGARSAIPKLNRTHTD